MKGVFFQIQRYVHLLAHKSKKESADVESKKAFNKALEDCDKALNDITHGNRRVHHR